MVTNHHLFHSIHQLSRLLTKYANKALQPFGLYSAQWSVIYVLKSKGSLTQTELCEYLSVEAPPLTRNIQRLVKLGYVNRTAGQDKRSKLVELTNLALQEYPKWEQAIVETNKDLVKHFSKDSQDQLEILLREWLTPFESSKGAGRE